MKTNKLLVLMFGMILLSMAFVSAYDTHEKNTSYELVVTSNNATTCNLSYIQTPDGTLTIYNNEMTKDGQTFYQNVTQGNFTKVGATCMGISCTDGTNNEVGNKCLDVTLSGIDPDSSDHTISLAFLFIIFGIAAVFLFLAFKVESPGVKIFFILASFVFLIGSLIMSYVVAFDSNMTMRINNTIVAMIWAFGFIFFTVLAYIMINQIKTAVSSIRENKGYEVEF